MAGLTAWLKEKRSSRERPVTSIVVVAAGSAARMEGVDKILVPLGELPAIVARTGRTRSAAFAGSTI